jgi:hypothetical protein
MDHLTYQWLSKVGANLNGRTNLQDLPPGVLSVNYGSESLMLIDCCVI